MNASGEMVSLPADVVAGVDELVGAERRDGFVAEAVTRALAAARTQEVDAAQRRARLTALLNDPTPVIKEEDHPELADGTETYVRRLRAEWRPREEAAEKAWHKD